MNRLAPGSVVGAHGIVRLVATGASSDVYEARHRTSGERAAVKVLHASFAADAGFVSRFLNEGVWLRELAHPHLVEVVETADLPDGRPSLVLEWMPADLARVLAGAKGVLPPAAAIHIARGVASALVALHARGIVHRDVKPGNVLLAGEGLAGEGLAFSAVKLADLGLSKLLPSGAADGTLGQRTQHVSTGQRVVFGTWEYMPPEQWVQSKTVDFRADVYSLGVLLFQMVAGRLPFIASKESDWMYHHVLDAPPLALIEGRVHESVRDLVGRMLEKKAQARPTMSEVMEALGGNPPR